MLWSIRQGQQLRTDGFRRCYDIVLSLCFPLEILIFPRLQQTLSSRAYAAHAGKALVAALRDAALTEFDYNKIP